MKLELNALTGFLLVVMLVALLAMLVLGEFASGRGTVNWVAVSALGIWANTIAILVAANKIHLSLLGLPKYGESYIFKRTLANFRDYGEVVVKATQEKNGIAIIATATKGIPTDDGHKIYNFSSRFMMGAKNDVALRQVIEDVFTDDKKLHDFLARNKVGFADPITEGLLNYKPE